LFCSVDKDSGKRSIADLSIGAGLYNKKPETQFAPSIRVFN